jgi:hypothetical protein
VKRLIAINLLVSLALVSLILGGLEAYLRFTVPASSSETIYAYTLETKRYKVMKANAAVTAWGKELRTNELGFRDRALAPKRPEEFRIVVLGDSFTLSAGVDFADIYTTRLEKMLGVRVINLAVGGYNIVQYGLVLQEVGLALEPDLVLVALLPDNDFSNETYENNRRVASGQASAHPAREWYEHLYLYRAYGTRLQTKLKALWGTPAAPGPTKSDAWQENVAALKAIAATAQARAIALEVALLPHTWNFEKQRPLFARVEKECARLGLACRNLLEPFVARGVDESSLRLNALDAHPNERYNALVAEELAGFLPRGSALLRTGGPAR